MVNDEKVKNIVGIVRNLVDARKIKDTLTEEKIEELIEETVKFLRVECLYEETEKCRHELKYIYMIKSTPGNKILNDYEQEEWYTARKDDIDPKFWTRYSEYLKDRKGFSPNVVSTLGNETLDMNLMNCLLDPQQEVESPVFRRGLVIGDVQSGKTSTYIGLICKAADAGYKVFILLTGMTEPLRQQTQERVEEGFIGINVSDGKRVGVGLDNQAIYATAFTSRKSDFRKKNTEIAIALKNNNAAVVFVIKKKDSVLNKLTEWLINNNADKVNGKIDLPMLMIDDEADNASVNTKKSSESPTTINGLIRRLANTFTRTTYVGFTATPFANVFIEPDTTDAMGNQDLFPEDFIVSLPVPTNYIGAEKIFDAKGRHHSQLIYIDDAGVNENDGYSFYSSHKKDWEGELPESLTDAIYAFYIVNAIRDLRGDRKTNRSMLINISRFTDVQRYIRDETEKIHDTAYRAIKFNLYPDDFAESMKNPVIRKIYDIWEKHFSSVEFSWSDIAGILFQSVNQIMIKVVNSSRGADKLVYPANDGIRVIAVGGLALSRGLTLEGLIISYFFRNTCTYDVLMQMGRWFGYRHGYEDLFRIWIGKKTAEWYADIADATAELKADMNTMNMEKRTPKEFGIRVRNDSEELQITSPNKMRNAKNEIVRYSYFGDIIETPYLVYNPEKQKENFRIVKQFTESLVSDGLTIEHLKNSRHIIQKVSKDKILGVLESLSISEYNNRFKPAQIINFLSKCHDSCIDLFDIVFIGGTSQKTVEIAGMNIKSVIRRNCEIDTGKDLLYIGRRGKLGGPTDGMTGIFDTADRTAEDIIEEAEKRFMEHYKPRKQKKSDEKPTYPGETWFKYVKDRRPLLIIYLIDAQEHSEKETKEIHGSKIFEQFKKQMGGIPSVGLAMGFPENNNSSATEIAFYSANRYCNYFEFNDILAESEEE
ncbi:MAG: hypothetical protein K2L10_04145 [Ruminococcus sp.]|nr:hypothetical protein [Ruminococcus sp.]